LVAVERRAPSPVAVILATARSGLGRAWRLRPRPPNHKCGPWGVGTDNDRRAYLNKKNATKSTYWRKLRLLALQRDGYRCTLQHHGCIRHATTVHIDPRLNGNHLAVTLNDCRSACRRCHGIKDAPRARKNR
jgi:5-methylcytosine-specific restriction endonuclease McrA